MPFWTHRERRLLLASSIWLAPFTGCSNSEPIVDQTAVDGEPSSDDDGNKDVANADDGAGDVDEMAPGTKDAGKVAGDGGKRPEGTADAGVGGDALADGGVASCEGIPIGKRCVKKEHVSFIDRHAQLTDEGNMVYAFDKTYGNIGTLKKNEPKVAPNADLGEWWLYNGDYVRIGVSYDSFVTAGGKIADKDRLPQRDGRNKDLTWSLNAVKALDNVTDLAAPNGTVCHYAYFEDKLISGLGRNKHWIASDASGFTLNVPVVGISSIFTGDVLSALPEDLLLLFRLFNETSHSHLFDLFAGFGMRHDPNTLKWTGNLDGDPNSNMKGWIDFPAWWNFKKKNALYANGSGRGELSNHLWYMNWFSLDGIPEAEETINNFVHVQKFIQEKIQAPKFEDFGGKINKDLAAKGEQVFVQSCSFCHGTYADNEADDTYPNALVDVDEVGTEPTLATNHWVYPVEPWYARSWYAKNTKTSIVKTHGYVAPPLDGVFMTAPYLHNGSVPTLEQVIDPSKRLAVWTSSMGAGDYDYEALGWKDQPLDLDVWSLDQNFGIYDTSEPGNSNQGHTYGAALSAEEKKQLLEYLKTL